MSWEALRLTSKSPSEVYRVLGPHGVEELLHQARSACWRDVPPEQRTFESVRARLIEVFDRNIRIWSAIKRPAPAAFFENLLPHAADGHIRQALVLTWMMMPRAGGRQFKDVARIVEAIFERMLAAWEQDNLTFTKGRAKAMKATAGKRRAAAGKPKARTAPAKKPAARAPKAEAVKKR